MDQEYSENSTTPIRFVDQVLSLSHIDIVGICIGVCHIKFWDQFLMNAKYFTGFLTFLIQYKRITVSK